MKKFNAFFALLLVAMISFTACSKDDKLTPEEQEAKQTKELVDQVTVNYTTITSKKWALKEFEGSESLIAASKTEDGNDALQIVTKAKYSPDLNMVLSFTKDGDLIKPTVKINVAEDDLEQTMIGILNKITTEAWGFPAYSELTPGQLLGHLADYRRFIAAPFAADALTTEQITNDETGLCIFSIGLRDYSAMVYDDVVLNQKKFIDGNSDKIYLNEDGTLTVETTSEKYGVSKLILEEVTE